jgi:hypothetical protein
MRNRSFIKSASTLQSLIGLGCGSPIGWSDQDLSEILRHQLDTALINDLAPNATQSADLAHLRSDSVDWTLTTFRGLLLGKSPPLHLLRLTKDFAKVADDGTDCALPPKVALVLYYSSISAALIYHRIRITELSDVGLREGLNWLSQQSWTGKEISQLARDAVMALDSIE